MMQNIKQFLFVTLYDYIVCDQELSGGLDMFVAGLGSITLQCNLLLLLSCFTSTITCSNCTITFEAITIIIFGVIWKFN